MAWIVLKEEKGRTILVSRSPKGDEVPGLIPKGSFLTVEQEETNSKYILRVEESLQYEPYSPSPTIIDMDLDSIYEDRKCQNIVKAVRIKDVTEREDGKIDYILPQSLARRSTQEEVNAALGNVKAGPTVFLATVHAGHNHILVDDDMNYLAVKLPEEFFYHQTIICGATGMGKTVAMKYLAQYFVEEIDGAVLAVNVKETDFLKMNRASETEDPNIQREWKTLDQQAHGVDNTTIYYPANTDIHAYRGIDYDICEKITLRAADIDADSLIGLLGNITDVAAQNLPDIFRFWQEIISEDGRFIDFLNYFVDNTDRLFSTLNVRGDESTIQLHSGTYEHIRRKLNNASEYFDDDTATTIGGSDILQRGKLSVINVVGPKGIEFGSILLRHLLKEIVDAKDQGISNVPVLIIIDEVHQFYNTESSREALGYLDTICRTGRSKNIGVIFSSQNPGDIPRGLSSVVNTKIFFKTSEQLSSKYHDLTAIELESLKKGYAISLIHEMSQLKILKFPLSLSGVIE